MAGKTAGKTEVPKNWRVCEYHCEACGKPRIAVARVARTSRFAHVCLATDCGHIWFYQEVDDMALWNEVRDKVRLAFNEPSAVVIEP